MEVNNMSSEKIVELQNYQGKSINNNLGALENKLNLNIEAIANIFPKIKYFISGLNKEQTAEIVGRLKQLV